MIAAQHSLGTLPDCARLVQRLPALGVTLYADFAATGGTRWYALDASGDVRAVTVSELLALARMQLAVLDSLAGLPRRRPPRLSSGDIPPAARHPLPL